MSSKENRATKRKSKCFEETELKINSPVGTWDVILCKQGLHFVKLERDKFTEIQNDIKVKSIPNKEQNTKTDIFVWMKNYFESPMSCASQALPEICPTVFIKDSFRQKAWKYIYTNVGFGETRSYGDIASGLGVPGAAQAVGSAMRTNPVSLVIPCHRIIRTGGSVGHYSGGTRDNLKVWLLQHESRAVSKSTGIGTFFRKQRET